MKKLFILFGIIFLSLCIAAQKTTVKNNASATLCDALSKIRSHIISDFEKINMQDTKVFYNQNKKEIGMGSQTTIQIPGAIHCYIVKPSFIGSTDYYAFFGTFSTITEAVNKIEPIKKQLVTCFNGFTMQNNPKIYSSKVSNPVNYIFTEKRTDNISPHHLSLYIYKTFDSAKNAFDFSTFLVIDGPTSIDVFSGIFDTTGTKKEPKDIPQPKLAKQLLELLDYTKDGFKSIKREKNKTERKFNFPIYSIENYYKTGYSLEGSQENSIKETFPNEKYMENPNLLFTATYGKGMTKTEGENLYTKLMTQIKQGFASGFEIREEKTDRYNDYIKTMRVTGDNDKKHYILLNLFFTKGFESFIADKILIEISVR